MSSAVEPSNPDNRQLTGASRWRIPAVVGGGLLVGGVVGWLLLSMLQVGPFRPQSFHGTEIQLPEAAVDFTLADPSGKLVSISDFRGQVVLLYFGYTYCPDICPSTLAELKKARQELGRDADETQTIMVTVDPERDTPEALANYLSHFDPAFIGLWGSEEEIKAAASPLGIFFEKQEGSVESGYLVDHTGAVLLVGRDGTWRLLYSIGTPGNDIASDIRLILKE
jgi:protein SCO1/2